MNTIKLLLPLLLIITACTAPAPDLGYVPGDVMDIEPLIIGETIPDITLQNHQSESVNLLDDNAENTLFVFYRGGWCPFCSAELAELASIENQLYNLGFNIVAISPDSPEFLRQTMNDTDINYTLLSDNMMEASKAFGIAYRLDDDTYQRYKSNGMDLEERSGQQHHLLPAPAVYLSNPEGIIEFEYVNPDYRQRIDKDVLMAAARSLVESQNE
ncbi:peroxiredoxin-like family protein [Rhodohalobacter sp. 8-1]|uniref:peroxiredoxin-like family protein n=1 Tax=Rhodohalobacter sp. 8-1 TaxID=3131972 RepID=UPI0030ECD278